MFSLMVDKAKWAPNCSFSHRRPLLNCLRITTYFYSNKSWTNKQKRKTSKYLKIKLKCNRKKNELFDLISFRATPETQICGTINPVTNFIQQKLDSNPLMFSKIHNEKCHKVFNNSKNTYLLLYYKLKFTTLRVRFYLPTLLVRHSVHSFLPSLS